MRIWTPPYDVLLCFAGVRLPLAACVGVDGAAWSISGGPPAERVPSEQEKVMTTKRAPAGLQEPEESSLKEVPDAHTSELDRSATWTADQKQPGRGADHGSIRRLSPCCFWRSRRDFGLTAWSNARRGRRAGFRQGGSHRVLPSTVPALSGRAPT